MTKPFRSFVIFAVALTVLIFAERADACTCSSPELADAVENAGNIVVLKVQTVEKYRADETGYGYGGVKQSRMTVEKIFKGNLKVGQELIFAQGGGADCIFTFDEDDVGTEYLFFLGGKPLKNNLWAGYICSRSNTLKGAAADLKYLEALPNAKGKTRLFGTLTKEDDPSVEGETGSYERLAGRSVTVSGNGKTFKLRTDENGVYELYDLAPGKYKVTPEPIKGYRFGDPGGAVEVEIKPQALTERDFDFEIDNSISGKFLDAYGKPLRGVYLDLIPARGNPPPYFYQGDVTEEDGSFNFHKIPAGTYLIVVNKENEISARQPFGTFYYPNKTARAEASELTIGAGDHFKNLIITAPTTAETITVSGVFLYENGRPAADEFVDFFQNHEDFSGIKKNQFADSRVKTDDNGRFSIRILKGQHGILFGWMTTYRGEFEKCPKLEALVKDETDNLFDVRTPPVKIVADRDIGEIELKFPFPSCKKAK